MGVGEKMKNFSFFYALKSAPILIRSRIELIFIWTWVTAVTCLIAGGGFPPIKPTLMSILAMFFISASVYLYNDISDIDMDSLNPTKKNRPLISETISVKDTMNIIYLFGLIGITISFLINVYSFIFSFIFLFLFTIYSYPKIRTKTKYLGKDLTIFSGWFLCGLVSSYAIVGTWYIPVLVTTLIFAVWCLLALPILNDAGDIVEDRLHGVKNISVLFSWDRKIQLLLLGFLFVIVITPLTYVTLRFNMILPIFTVALSIIFLRLIYPKIVNFQMSEYPQLRKLGYIYFTLLEIIFIFGSINLNIFS